jgi:hypothetical protein
MHVRERKQGEEIHGDIVCGCLQRRERERERERETPSTWPREVWQTREGSRERRMEKIEAWGGREGVFMTERSPRDREGTIWVGDRETRCVCDRKIPQKRMRYA